jgi:hypothetical protein
MSGEMRCINSRFTDDAKGFARLHIKGHAVDGLHDSLCPVQQSALESEMLGQVLDRQERPGLDQLACAGIKGGPTELSPDVATG